MLELNAYKDQKIVSLNDQDAIETLYKKLIASDIQVIVKKSTYLSFKIQEFDFTITQVLR